MCSVIYKRMYHRVINLLPKCCASQAMRAVDICAFWVVSLLHVKLGLRVGSVMELFPKCFVTVPIEKVCSCRVVWAWHCCVLGQRPAPAAQLCSMQGLTPNREKQTCLGVIFLESLPLPFTVVLSLWGRGSAFLHSAGQPYLTCHSSFLPVSVTGSYAHSHLLGQ